MDVKKILKQKIDGYLVDLNIGETSYVIENNESLKFGDLSCNVALVIYPKVKDRFKSARELAEDISKSLKNIKELKSIFEDIKVEGSGFINVWLRPEIFTDFIKQINTDINTVLQTLSQPRKIMVEFAHPNTHKQFHLGHLRTLLVGGSLSKLLETVGNEIFKANYEGDIGPHVAKAVYGVMKLLKDRNLTLVEVDAQTPFEKAKFLQDSYIIGNQDYESHKEEIDELNNKLYLPAGRQVSELFEVYKTTRAWSLEYFDFVYQTFGIKFDRLFFESEVAENGKKIVLENVGKVFENDNETIIFKGEKYGLHTRVFLTKAGNPTYEGKDMGLAYEQFKTFPFDLNIHVVGAEQKEYFKVVFKALELMDPKFKGREHHLSMGMVGLTSGKMSSRTGDIVTIEKLLELVKEAVSQLVGSGRIEQDEKEDTVEKITRAAIAYTYLKVNPQLDFTFDVNKSISLDGDSGPYLLYAFARIRSIIEKSKIKDLPMEFHSSGSRMKTIIGKRPKTQIKNKKEMENGNWKLENLSGKDLELSRKLYGFTNVVQQAAYAYSPNVMANYLYDLAREFNSYYQEVSILKAENEELVNIRLSLISAVANVLKEGLALLNIETVERM